MIKVEITGNSVKEIADSMAEMATQLKQDTGRDLYQQPQKTEKAVDDNNEKTPAQKAEPEAKPVEKKKEPNVTADQLKDAALEKIKAKKRDEVQAVFEAHGAEKLPEIKTEDYSAVLSELEAL